MFYITVANIESPVLRRAKWTTQKYCCCQLPSVTGCAVWVIRGREANQKTTEQCPQTKRPTSVAEFSQTLHYNPLSLLTTGEDSDKNYVNIPGHDQRFYFTRKQNVPVGVTHETVAQPTAIGTRRHQLTCLIGSARWHRHIGACA